MKESGREPPPSQGRMYSLAVVVGAAANFRSARFGSDDAPANSHLERFRWCFVGVTGLLTAGQEAQICVSAGQRPDFEGDDGIRTRDPHLAKVQGATSITSGLARKR